MGFRGVSPQTLASVGLLRAGHATPTLLLLFPSYCYCLDSRALLFCDTLPPWTPGHPDPGGGWVPPCLCSCCSPALPWPPPPFISSRSPGALRFHHMSGEVNLATAGVSLGAAEPLPQPRIGDHVAGVSLRERLGGLFLFLFISRERFILPRLWLQVPDRWQLSRGTLKGSCYLFSAHVVCCL